ncbi:MAG: phage protease [Pseudomonadota bacterium]
MKNGSAFAVEGVSLNVAEGGAAAPTWVQITPPGPVLRGVDGRTFDVPNPQDLVDRFVSENQTIPVDINHSTETKAMEGDPSPAVGWISTLEVRDGAIWAEVAWNDAGKAAIEAREYRYLSPTFWLKKKSNTPFRISSVGLVNTPNFQMAALNGAKEEEDEMSLAEIAKALNLAEDADEAAILGAIGSMKSDHETALNAAKAGVPDPAKFVPRADYDAAINRAEEAEKDLKTRDEADLDGKIEAAVNAAIEARKIAPASKDHWVTVCKGENGLKTFEGIMAATPKIIGDVNLAGDPGAAGMAQLSEDQKAACATLGMSEEEYLEILKAEKKEG